MICIGDVCTRTDSKLADHHARLRYSPEPQNSRFKRHNACFVLLVNETMGTGELGSDDICIMQHPRHPDRVRIVVSAMRGDLWATAQTRAGEEGMSALLWYGRLFEAAARTGDVKFDTVVDISSTPLGKIVITNVTKGTKTIRLVTSKFVVDLNALKVAVKE